MTYPLSKSEAGKAMWQTMFQFAANYPDNPNRSDRITAQNWIKNTIPSLGCQKCVTHAFEFMNTNPINVENSEGLAKWICALKNNANQDEHKPEIDCNDFYKNHFNKGLECSTCSLINKPKEPILLKNKTTLANDNDDDYMNSSFFSDWDMFNKPSKKSNFAVNNTGSSSTMISDNSANEQIGNNLTQTFPSLAYFDEFGNNRGNMVQTPNGQMMMQPQQQQPQEEELDGILKPLDGLYTFPASVVGTKPSDFNLAYTPEFVANLYSLINQIFLTNFGSLLSISLGSVLLFAVSVLAKNNLSYYDRLFLQNTIASILFHTINYVNPRTKDEIIPMATQFFEGLTTMDVEKMKKSLLYDGKNHNSGKKTSGVSDNLLQLAMMDENLDPALKQKLILASRGGKQIDMEKMKEPRGSILSMGSDISSSFASSSVRDLQNSSMSSYDSLTGGGSRMPGGGGGSGIMNKSSLENMFNARARYNRNSPTMRDYNMSKQFASPSVLDTTGLDSNYDFILDNQLL